MLRLRQKELLWMGLESQEERLRWLDSELNRLKLSKELRSVPVVQELADEGEGLGPRWRDIASKLEMTDYQKWFQPEQRASLLCLPTPTVFSFLLKTIEMKHLVVFSFHHPSW